MDRNQNLVFVRSKLVRRSREAEINVWKGSPPRPDLHRRKLQRCTGSSGPSARLLLTFGAEILINNNALRLQLHPHSVRDTLPHSHRTESWDFHHLASCRGSTPHPPWLSVLSCTRPEHLDLCKAWDDHGAMNRYCVTQLYPVVWRWQPLQN